MASSDLVTSKAPTNKVVAVAGGGAESSWAPLSQPKQFGDEKRRKGIRPESQSQQLPFPPYLPPYQTMHYSWQNQFMPRPPPPPNYVPPSGFASSSTYNYVPTSLPPAPSFGLPTPVYVPPPSPSPSPSTSPSPSPSPSELTLRQKVIQQIEYYFCDDNLAKDVYLRSKMDDKGWVGVYVIASFRRVSQLTNYCEVILDCMRYSNSVELQVHTGKLRSRANWSKWILDPSLKASLKDSNLLPKT